MSDWTRALPVTLVRLKVRLIANRARTSKGGVVQLVVSCGLAVVLGSAGALVAIAAGSDSDPLVSRNALVIGASFIALGWALLPLLTFGSDESLDPNRLVLFPLRRGPLMGGLLLSAFIGPAPGMVVIIVLGAVVGYARGGAFLLVVAAMALLLALSAATARTLTTVLASGLTSRRGRDATIVLASLLALGLQGLRFVHYSAISADLVHRVADVLSWLPPGMLAQAAIDARAGHITRAILELLPAAALILLLLRWWARALDRATTVVADAQTRPGRRTAGASLPLMFPRLTFLNRGPWGAVAAKELRYATREPRRKVTIVNSTLIGIALPVWVALRAGPGQGSRAVLLATVAGYIAVLGSSNQFGLDGPAVWLDMVAGDTMRSVLIGKNVAVALEVLPVVTIVGSGVAALTGGWVYLPAAILLALAGLGVGLATADVVSVRFPFRLPENRSPFAGSGGGQGCTTSLILFSCMIVQNVLLLPVVAAVAVATFVGPIWLLVVVPLAATYGTVMWVVGVNVATGLGRSRQPEILIEVDPARTS